MIRYVIISGVQQVIVSDHFAASVIAEQLARASPDAGHATVREEVMTRGKWQLRNTHTVMHTCEEVDYSDNLGDFDV